MKPGFVINKHTLIIFLTTIAISGCVQPYSMKAFYKGSNTGGNTPSTAAANDRSLSSDDIANIINMQDVSERKINSQLTRVDPHWRIKGFDAKTHEVIYFNFYSKDNKEAFIWHRDDNSAEYVTTNANNYMAFVNNLKATGYKRTSGSAQDGDHYSNGKTDVDISPVQIFDGSGGYKIFFKAAIK